jgi:hypothetical protein
MPRRQAISHRQAKRSAQPAAGLDLVLALHRLLAGVGNLLGPKSVRDPRSQMESIFSHRKLVRRRRPPKRAALSV